jgi:hypothetical protein
MFQLATITNSTPSVDEIESNVNMYKRSLPIWQHGFYVWGDGYIKFKIYLNANFGKGSSCNLHCKNNGCLMGPLKLRST